MNSLEFDCSGPAKRRIFNLTHLFKQVKEVARHGTNSCGWAEVDLLKELQNGMWSSFEFKCRECHLVFNVTTEDDQQKGADLTAFFTNAEAKVEFPALDAILKAADLPQLRHNGTHKDGSQEVGRGAVGKEIHPEPQGCQSIEPNPFDTANGLSEIENRVEQSVPQNPKPTGKTDRISLKNRFSSSARCFYCGKVVLRRSLFLHFVRKHKDRDDVKKLLRSPCRPIHLKRLKRKCDEHFVETKWKKLDPNYLPCVKCKNLYRYESLKRHCANCLPQNRNNNKKLSRILSVGFEQDADDFRNFKIKVILGIKTEIIRDFIINDAILTEYGVVCMNLVVENRQFQRLRENLHFVTSVFLVMQEKHPEMYEILDVFDPEKWASFVEAVHKYTKSTAKLCNLHSQFYIIARFAATRCKRLDIDVYRLSKWLIWYKNNRIQVVKKRLIWSNLNWLTVAERLAVLFKFAHDELRFSLEKLKTQGFEPDAFETLNYAVMLKIVSYNRNRILNLDQIEVTDFVKRQPLTRETDLWKCLDESEKFTAKRSKYMEIRVKRGRSVPILFDAFVEDAIETILAMRDQVDDHSSPYIFGYRDAFFCVDSAVNKFASKCGVGQSCTAEVILSSDLKKYVACMAHALSMNNSDVALLGSVLESRGCSEVYGENVVDGVMMRLARLFRVLIAMNEEGVEDLKGVNIDEINVTGNIGVGDRLGKSCCGDTIDDDLKTDQKTPPTPTYQQSLRPLDSTSTCSPVIEESYNLSNVPQNNSEHKSVADSPNPYRNHYLQSCREGQQHHFLSTVPYTNEFPYYSTQYDGCSEYLGFPQTAHSRWTVPDPIPDYASPPKAHSSRSKSHYDEPPYPKTQHKPRNKSPSSKIKRISWTTDEKQCLINFFGPDIFTEQKLPSYYACNKVIAQYPCLQMRTKAQVKAFINNEQRKWKKRCCQSLQNS